MRVLHIINSLGRGGAEAVLNRLCTSSSERKGDAIVSLTSGEGYGDSLRSAGLDVHALELNHRVSWLLGPAKLYRIIRSARPDLIQTWLYHSDLFGGLVANLAGDAPIVWGLHNSTLDSETTPATTRWTVRVCALLAQRIPSRIVSCSQNAAKLHTELGYPSEKIIIIPNGYDLADFRPDPRARASLRSELSLDQDERVVGMVARSDPQKHVENLLDALAHLKSNGEGFTCLLVGRGMEVENSDLCDALDAKGLSGRVRLLGVRKDIPTIMNALDLHVLSSAYGEAFPNVVAEAMACGTPCVVTDIGDSALIVGDTGWVVPPRNSSALACAISAARRAKDTPTSWYARQAACRNHIVANFGLERMVASYETLWQQLCNDNRLKTRSNG